MHDSPDTGPVRSDAPQVSGPKPGGVPTLLPLLLIAALLVAAVALPRLLRGPATVPAVFDAGSTLDAALERSEETGRPVLVLVTSDSCSACERLKSTTLKDARVTDLVADRSIPITINEDVNPDDARRLPYMYLPSTLVIRDGTVVARLQGYRPAEQYLGWLDASLADPDAAGSPPGGGTTAAAP